MLKDTVITFGHKYGRLNSHEKLLCCKDENYKWSIFCEGIIWYLIH